jgi:hypothetical protein
MHILVNEVGPADLSAMSHLEELLPDRLRNRKVS